MTAHAHTLPKSHHEPVMFGETLYTAVQQRFQVDKIIFREQSEFQDVMIFENPVFGRILTLDGVIQVTERDEPAYHEMMTHVPLLSHPDPKKVLIIGGGDGGIARECLKHPGLDVTMVELDPSVTEMCREYMPTISNGAFENPRLRLVFQDGCVFMKDDSQHYDVILVDSTDPIGPGAVLFTEEFYHDCYTRLTANGILVTQNGVPFLQSDELVSSVTKFRTCFADGGCYVTAVPTYYGGFMALGWASKDAGHRHRPVAEIAARAAEAGLVTRYYTPDLHKAAFAVPAFIQNLLQAIPAAAG
jgi:spermidine synthase